MTNFEYYKDEIKKIADAGNTIAFRDGKIVVCTAVRCSDCEFKYTDKSYSSCENRMLLWLCREYKETPRLTAKEYGYLSFLEEGYMVRQRDAFGEDIRVYHNKPKSIRDFCDCLTKWYGSELKALINANVGLFDFVKVDDEPYDIEEMLTWEHEVEHEEE